MKSFTNHLFKNSAFILFVLLGAFNSKAQTFSLRFNEEMVTVLSNVWEVEMGYMVGGVIPDNEDGFHYDALICSLSTSGELLYSKKYGTLDHSYISVHDCNTISNDGSSLLACYRTYDSDTVKLALIWYDLNGDTLKTKSFKSPLWYGLETFQANWLRPYYMSSDSTGIYIACGTTDEETGNDFIIFKTNWDGELLWHYPFATDTDPDLCYTLGAVDDGVIVSGCS